MKVSKYYIFLFAILSLNVSNVIANQNTQRFQIPGISFSSPGQAWQVKQVHKGRIEFAKIGRKTSHSFVASVFVHKLPDTTADTDNEFLNKISNLRWNSDTSKGEQTRYKLLLNNEKITRIDERLCLHYHAKYEDHSTKTPYLIVEDFGLICRYLENAHIGASIGISQRYFPGDQLTNFGNIANNFLSTLKFEDEPKL